MGWKRVDDLTGTSEDVELVTFGFDGVAYMIDLDKENHEALTVTLERYIAVATRYDALPPVQSTTGAATAPPNAPATRPVRVRAPRDAGVVSDAQRARDWARAQGWTVKDHGRIPGAVVEAYEIAMRNDAGGPA